jgi:3-hydroxybutyryl-CoA dehydrogenase
VPALIGGSRLVSVNELPGTVAVVGAGTMGVGIARVFAQAGCAVRLGSRRADSLRAARERLGSIVDRVEMSTSIDETLAGADLLIETITEAVEPKRRVLVRAEQMAADGVILTTNTSSLRLAELSTGLGQPERFAGLHWLNPPELVELVEVVPAERTAPEVLSTLRDWMTLLGKTPIVLQRDVPGFVANRLQYALLREAYALADSQVCSLEEIDRAVTHGLGARWAAIGPFETMDLAGLDVHASVAANLYPALSNDSEPSPRLAAAIAGGALGVENGHGLRGNYETGAVGELLARRDRTLRGVALLRAGQEIA